MIFPRSNLGNMIYHHIYNRGAHKAPVFEDRSDYERMLKLLYIANCSQAFNLRDLGDKNFFKIERPDTLINIVAYCLMPNHIHIALTPRSDLGIPGITKFVRKLCTGYSGYYNFKNKHSGTIWQGHYKETTLDEIYLPLLISYIHLNPYFGIANPGIARDARPNFTKQAHEYSMTYEYSSMQDYDPTGRTSGAWDRPQRAILDFPRSDLGDYLPML